MATGDPHITTIDGVFYHLYDIGQFILVKSKTHRKFEVRMSFILSSKMILVSV